MYCAGNKFYKEGDPKEDPKGALVNIIHLTVSFHKNVLRKFKTCLIKINEVSIGRNCFSGLVTWIKEYEDSLLKILHTGDTESLKQKIHLSHVIHMSPVTNANSHMHIPSPASSTTVLHSRLVKKRPQNSP